MIRRKMPKKQQKSKLFLDKKEYNECIEGLMAQGLDRKEAIETLSIGLRQANGIPVKDTSAEKEQSSDSSLA